MPGADRIAGTAAEAQKIPILVSIGGHPVLGLPAGLGTMVGVSQQDEPVSAK